MAGSLAWLPMSPLPLKETQNKNQLEKLNYEFLPVPLCTIKDIGLTNANVLGLIVKLTNGIGYCYPSNSYICRELQLSEPTVKRSLKKLEEEKYIKRETNRIHGRYDRKIFLSGKHGKGIQQVKSESREKIGEQPNTNITKPGVIIGKKKNMLLVEC